MASVEATEAERQFVQLLERVENGEEISITRHGNPVARLVPVARAHNVEAVMATFRRMQDRAKEINLGPFDWEEWKSYRDEGRR